MIALIKDFPPIRAAIDKVYKNIGKIDDGTLYYRTDIGKKAI